MRREVVLITGGGSRLGKSLSLAFARAGADIAIHFFSSENEARLTSNLIKSTTDVGCEIFQADFRSTEDVNNMFIDVLDRFKKIDHLINNAAVFTKNLSNEIEALSILHRINFEVPEILTRKMMYYCGSSVLNISDSRAIRKAMSMSTYSFLKKKLLTMHSDFLDLSKLRINCLCPGIILEFSSLQERELVKSGSEKDFCRVDFVCSEAVRLVFGRMKHVVSIADYQS